MCLAIGSTHQCSNSLFARSWRRLSATPFRLFSLSAGFHLLLCAGIYIFATRTNTTMAGDALLLAFLYGIMPLPVFGVLMTGLPEKYSLSPVHYGRYTGIQLLLFAGLMIIEAGAWVNASLVIAGLLLLAPAWLMVLQTVRHLHEWLPSDRQVLSKAVLFLLWVVFASLVFFVGTAANSIAIPVAYHTFLAFVIVTALSGSLLAYLALMLKAPRQARVIKL